VEAARAAPHRAPAAATCGRRARLASASAVGWKTSPRARRHHASTRSWRLFRSGR